MKKLLTLAFLTLLHCTASATDINKIAATADEVSPVLNGQMIPDATLYDLDDKPVSLKSLVSQQPTVLIFYRGGWCPYCSAQLAGLKQVEQQIMALGYQLIAISPDSPAKLKDTAFETDFKVKLYSDKNFEVSSEFGIGFFLADKTAKRYRNKMGIEFVTLDGTSKVALPVPAVYIADTEGLVHFNYVNPNFRVRISPELLYQAAKTLAL
ncbi:peroxiredoxin-like family protein [Planctobacterium marinum]|uniref:thioredoxin-dependent peroxiredoxin n=1 Tax=Planctobacterium marinum TaxID=1631968 RepID=A0AA48I9I3_9ALTE|nr:alkyl hydroperoxide reductase [Planctobacterium marinum]